MKKILLFIPLIGLVVLGCSRTPPTNFDQTSARYAPPPTPRVGPTKLDQNGDFGPKPNTAERLDVIKLAHQNIARDPDSIKVRLDRDFFKQTIYSEKSPTPISGWAICYSVNGKNAYGGYVGFEPNYELIKNGELIQLGDGKNAVEWCSQ